MSEGVFISDISFALGSRQQSLADAEQLGLLVSSADQLQRAGFAQHWVASELQNSYDLAFESVKTMNDVSDANAIVYSTCLPLNASIESSADHSDVRHLMDFPASHLQADFEMRNAAIFGLTQQGCTGALGAVRLGRSLLLTEPNWQTVLCVTSDRFPAGARYEQSYSLISDGASSFVMSTIDGALRVVSSHQISNGAMVEADDDETAGAYFTHVHRLLSEISIDRLDWIVPQNMNVAAWKVMCGLIGFEYEKVWSPTLSQVGHVISSDGFINLKALQDSGRLRSGERIAMVMAGYGMHWQAVLLEVT